MIISNEKDEICVDYEGFLEEIDFQMPIVKVYKEAFDLINQINRYMYSIYYMAEPIKSDRIGCFLFTTYNKIHKNIQSAIIVATRGLSEQVKIFARSILDKLMIMQAVSNDNDNFDKWVEQQKFEVYRLVDAIKKGEPGLEQLKNSIPADKVYPKGKRVTQREWAKMAEMEVEYNVVYRLFSGNVHYSASSFEADLIFEDGLPSALDIGPKFDDISELLATIATDALRAVNIIVDYFNIDDAKYKELNESLEDMQRKIMAGSL